MPTENEKQLTAMQQLIQYNDELIAVYGDTMTTFDLHNKVMKRATDLLATERKNLIDFYKQGQHDAPPIRETDAEQYFEQTFKTQQ